MIYNYFILIQVKSFEGKGIKMAFIGKDQTDENIRSNVIAGEYSLVYMSPESMLYNKSEVSGDVPISSVPGKLGVLGHR